MASAILGGQSATIDEMMTKTAEDHRAHAALVGLGEKGGDPCAHRIAHHIGHLNLKMIEKPFGILRHFRHGIGRGFIKFLAAAMPAIVESDRPAGLPRSRFSPIAEKPNSPHGLRQSHE